MSKRPLTDEDLAADWFLHPAERCLLANKSRTTHVGFSILLKYFQLKGRFPTSPKEIPPSVVQYVAYQLDATAEDWEVYPWNGATIKRHRPEIREWYGYREATINDKNAFRQWLISEAIPLEHREDRLREVLLKHCRALRIEPPAAEQIRRLIQSALAEHETSFCNKIVGSMNSAITERLNALLQLQTSADGEWTVWQTLKNDPGKAGLESIKEAVSRLQAVRDIGIPVDLFKIVPPKLLERYAKRASQIWTKSFIRRSASCR